MRKIIVILIVFMLAIGGYIGYSEYQKQNQTDTANIDNDGSDGTDGTTNPDKVTDVTDKDYKDTWIETSSYYLHTSTVNKEYAWKVLDLVAKNKGTITDTDLHNDEYTVYWNVQKEMRT